MLKFIVVTLLVIPSLLFSQKIHEEPLTFEYVQLPLKPLDKTIKNYTSDVVLAYEEKVKAKKQKAQDEYEQEQREYPDIEAKARVAHDLKVAEYKKALAQYNKKSVAVKLLETQTDGGSTAPRSPGKYYPPRKPRLKTVRTQKVFNRELLADSYLNLEGFSKADDNAVSLIATLYGFESNEPERKEGSKKVKKGDAYVTVKTYWVEVKYKHPVKLNITTPDGKVVFDQVLPETKEYKIYKSEVKDSYVYFNYDDVIPGLQEKIISQNMKLINEYLADNHGFVKKERKSAFYRVESKKMDYTDFQGAYESAYAGYLSLLSDKESAMTKLSDAITKWETILKESDPTNKKARINKNITAVTLLNLAQVYAWTNDFAKAEMSLIKVTSLKAQKKYERRMGVMKKFYTEQKSRWKSNQ